MIDRYFKHPIFWDYFLSIIGITTALFLQHKGVITMPKEEYVYSIISDLSTVSLTMVGFILTLVTVLISFKSSRKIAQPSDKEKDSVFDIFFASILYFDTIKHLKNGIKSLTVVALTGYTLKLTVDHLKYEILFLFCFGAIVIMIMTIGRSLFILSQIIKIQQS